MELIDSKRKDLFPLGRLDKDTEGVLLISNDGVLGHHLLSPKYHVDKKYYVETDKPITPEAEEILSADCPEYSKFFQSFLDQSHLPDAYENQCPRQSKLLPYDSQWPKPHYY